MQSIIYVRVSMSVARRVMLLFSANAFVVLAQNIENRRFAETPVFRHCIFTMLMLFMNQGGHGANTESCIFDVRTLQFLRLRNIYP